MIWRLIIGGLWKPILAVITALGLYAKIRSGDKAKDTVKDQAETIKAHEARNEADDSADTEPDPHGKLRDNWTRR